MNVNGCVSSITKARSPPSSIYKSTFGLRCDPGKHHNSRTQVTQLSCVELYTANSHEGKRGEGGKDDAKG